MLLERGNAVAIFAVAILAAVACTSAQHKTSIPVRAATTSATARPTANPDQAAGLVTRFYRDVATGTKQSISDFASIVSRDFLRAHHDDFIADYAFISDPKVQIQGVRANVISYVLDYSYKAEGGAKLFWQRAGQWTLNHGARSGWVLDKDSWDSVHLVAISTPDHPDPISVQDRVYRDGRHEFMYRGLRYSFLAKGDGWHVTALSTPQPPTTAVAYNDSTTAATAPEQQTPISQTQPLPITPSSDCEEVSVEDVYDDGKILALDDGRHLSVAEYDTPTSETWVAPFDGLICDGDRFINKDDNEAVDVSA